MQVLPKMMPIKYLDQPTDRSSLFIAHPVIDRPTSWILIFPAFLPVSPCSLCPLLFMQGSFSSWRCSVQLVYVVLRCSVFMSMVHAVAAFRVLIVVVALDSVRTCSRVAICPFPKLEELVCPLNTCILLRCFSELPTVVSGFAKLASSTYRLQYKHQYSK